MKAIILAAGIGKRMMPLTFDKPKVMINVNEKPFLYYVIERLNLAGFNDIAVVVGYKKEVIINYGFNVKIIEQRELTGSASALKVCEDFVNNENFVVVNGDSLFSVEDYKTLNKDDEFCYIAGIRVKDPSRYGVLLQNKGLLRRIVEKPTEFVGDLINVGIYKFTHEIFNAISKIKISQRGEFEITDAISILALDKKVKVLIVKEMVDFGSLGDIEKVKLYLSKKA